MLVLNPGIHITRRALVLLVFLGISNTTFAQTVGTVIFSLGDVTGVHQNGEEWKVRRGDNVYLGDIIVTQAGQAQIRMEDSGLIQINRNSKIRISDFHYSGDESKDKTTFDLLKGAMRSLTGNIGKQKKENFSLISPVGSIGIRGTDFLVRYCNNDCDNAADGIYAGVVSGGITLRTDVASLDVNPGEFVYAQDLESEPGFIDAEDVGSLLMASSTPSDSDSIGGNTDFELALAMLGVSSEGDSVNYLTQTIVANQPLVNFAKTTSAGLISGNELLYSGTLLEHGADSTTGVEWGVYAAGTQYTTDGTGGTAVGSDSHWVIGKLDSNFALPSTGSASYTATNWTTPTVTTGGTAVFSSSTLSVNFAGAGASTVTANVDFTLGTDGWSASSGGMLINTDGTFNGSLAGLSITPFGGSAATDVGASGAFSGGLSGSVASGVPSGAFLAYQVQDSTGINNVVGTASFTKNP
ncbi:MAG: FecR family protein [Gammaproteobacteria bacterium]|nr:FecR family protein [Gammaproteobacteria bacterium]MDH5692425.1 FecR family protein [Gammaproteobacteria bacterium]